MELVYDQLRALAGSYAGGRAANHTLQPTALVHELFLKLVRSGGARYNDRSHFFAVAATALAIAFWLRRGDLVVAQG